MKLKKTLKIQKGGLIRLNKRWKCDIEKCKLDDEKESIDFTKKYMNK